MKMDELTKNWVDREIYECELLLKNGNLRDVEKMSINAYLKSLKKEDKK